MHLFRAQNPADRPRRRPLAVLAALALAGASLAAAPVASAAAAPAVHAAPAAHAAPAVSALHAVPAPPAGLRFRPHAGGSPAILRHSAHSPSTVRFQEESSNWAGYAADSTTYTEVSSSWTEPSANCSTTPNSLAAFWVGIDGYDTDSVEQTGTLVYCDGTTLYQYAWYEFYPAAPVYYSVTLVAGDKITGTVTATTAGAFTLTLTDTTRGWNEVTHETNSSLARGSAEIIAEAPSSSSGVEPLADFGVVSFTGATINNAPLASSNPINIEMVGPTDVKAVTSGITSSENFTVTWEHAT